MQPQGWQTPSKKLGFTRTQAVVHDPFAVARRAGVQLTSHPRVRIQEEAVEQLGNALTTAIRAQGTLAYAWDDPKFWPVEADPFARSQLLAVGNALNFRFWRRSEGGDIEALGGPIRGEHFTGSMYLWRRLRVAYDDGLPVTKAEYLAGMDTNNFDDIFVDDFGNNPLAEARPDRIQNLRNLGAQLTRLWNGEFYNLVNDAQASLPKFMHLSRRLRAYDDPIGKLTLVNALMHRGSGLAHFTEALLPAIDYQILKQLLRQRVLVPDRELDHKLRRADFLTDEEGQQLRSAALNALLRTCVESDIPGDLVDNQLWRNRTICLDAGPRCSECKFNTFCAQDVHVQRPLLITRYF